VPLIHGMKDRRSHPIDQPLPTITTMDAMGLVQPFLVEYRGNHKGNRDGHRRVASLDAPLPTQDTSNRFGVVEPYIVSYYGNHCLTPVSEPLPTCTAKDRFGLVQFAKGIYLDIHFRMLQWHELAAAMGFPPDYEFAGTREDKVRQIGQAVEVRTAKALVRSALAA
jgi:DNA (cytosine-5)-methyltransferase 1